MTDHSAERDERKRRLVEAFRLFGRLGYSEGSAGHLSARDPELTDAFWAAPYQMHFSCVRLSDLVLTDTQGTLHEGTRPAHPATLVFHGAVHAARPDIIAAAHTHTDYARAMATLGRRVLAITQDSCAFSDDTGYLDEYSGVVLDESEGKLISATLGDHKALLLRHHGMLTVGGSVEEMAWWFLSLEQVCKVQLLAQAAGELDEIPEPVRSKTAALVGSPGAALINAKPMLDWIRVSSPTCTTDGGRPMSTEPELPQHADHITIARAPDEVYTMVSDVTRMGEWSPVCRSCWWDEGDGPRVGAWFTGHNEQPDRTWDTRCEVIAADPGASSRSWSVAPRIRSRVGATRSRLSTAVPSSQNRGR